MGKENALVNTLKIGFLMFVLSGCGSQETANSVMDAIKNEEFSTAKQIYQDAFDESEDPIELEEAVSKDLQDYLYDVYQETDTSEEPGFYYLLTSIEEIGIDDYDLDDKIQNYKEMFEESESYEEADIDESFEEDTYVEEEEETTSDNSYSATDIDHDCPDFDTQEDAQLFYEANGGPEQDPHDLDRDNDGMACDWNDEEYLEEDSYDEEVEEVSASDNPYSATDIDHDCKDFATGEDAQLFYIANGGPEEDPHDLDRDNDGRACDWNP